MIGQRMMFSGEVYIHTETVKELYLDPHTGAFRVFAMALIVPEEGTAKRVEMGAWIPEEYIQYLPSTIENRGEWLLGTTGELL